MLFVSIARMHHIRSLAKLRRLKKYAADANISGIVKTGRPGVLIFDGTSYAIKRFLECARSLRYLEFRHVDTIPLNTPLRIANAKIGLYEIENMSSMVDAIDKLGLKTWFKIQMGMDNGR